MTVHTLIKPTGAEQALLDAFGQAVGMLPGDAAVTTQRSALLRGLREGGLPTRRRESWHYTDLRSLLRTVPANQSVAATPVAPLVEGSRILSVVNGAVQPASVPDGVAVRAYAESLADGSALPGLSLRDDDDLVGRLNGGFVRDGLVIDVAEGVALSEALEIQSVQGGGHHHTRFPVRFGPSMSRAMLAGEQASTSRSRTTSAMQSPLAPLARMS